MPKLMEKMTKTNEQVRLINKPLVVALVYDGLCTFEFGIVAEVFGLSRPELGRDLYSFKSVSLEGNKISASGGLTVQATGNLADFEKADIIVVPGWRGKDEIVPKCICDKLRAAHARGAKILSICSGVYVLAAAGLLDNRCATTHWQYVEDLQTRYPKINVRTNDLYVDEGDILTSAGSSAGIDVCLHIVKGDYGAKIANSVARRLVMHTHRRGGQAQFIEQPMPQAPNSHRLSEFIETVRNRLADVPDITTMAVLAGMSIRTFQRRFLAFTGIPAMQWLIQERISRSCLLLETTNLSIESISYEVGFGNAETMRYHFRQVIEVTPLAYRKRFSVSIKKNARIC